MLALLVLTLYINIKNTPSNTNVDYQKKIEFVRNYPVDENKKQ